MIKIVFEDDNNRTAAYDGTSVIGESSFSRSSTFWIIDHTFVEDDYAGLGIGGKLVAELVEEARKAQVKIMPLCPFAKKEFDEKPEYSDVLMG